jgi:uncharacterized RDD family membrane protein YckC
MEPQTEATEAAAPVVQVPTATPVAAATGTIQTFGGVPVAAASRRLVGLLMEFVLVIATLFVGYIIWSLVLWGQGQSPGKKVLGLRVVKVSTGQAATRGTMALREIIGKMCSNAGPMWIVNGVMILGASHRGIADLIAGTVVVEDKDGVTVAA